jgi:antitoxin VapB
VGRETDIKLDRVARIAREAGVAGVVLTTQRNFAWVTGGGSNRIDGSRETGAGALLIGADGRRFVVANAIEMPRLLEEPLAGLEFAPVEYPWIEDHAKPSAVIAHAQHVLSSSGLMGTDAPVGVNAIVVEPALMRTRVDLVDEEIARYRDLGRDMGTTLGSVCSSLRPGLSERDVANGVAAAVCKVGARPVVMLVAGDHRIGHFRHPVPTDYEWRKSAMVVVCAERHGLVVALSRIVSCGPIDSLLEERTAAAARVFATLLAGTREGATGAALFETAARAYAENGFPGEEQKHHQGGAIGYRTRASTPGVCLEPEHHRVEN